MIKISYDAKIKSKDVRMFFADWKCPKCKKAWKDCCKNKGD